jgi:pyruvate/2-oxoglutarate dehydrogenase complex dihydrolipoamide dehydrogenase (E3) component/uncharacterized membrane protein YdjX (TVP38/TMEM64 family)
MIKKLALLLLICAVITGYFLLGGQQYLNVEFFRDFHQHYPWRSALVFFGVYVLATALSLPAAALLTLIGGMLFGLVTGTVLVSFASSIGATLACLLSRYLLADWVRKKLGGYRHKIDKGLAQGGGSYLFSLRLIPIFPFWAINLAFGLTRLSLTKFYLVSQVGMLPATLVYVNAGAQLGAVDSFTVEGVLTPAVIASFVLLAIFPYVIKGGMSLWHRRNLYKPFKRPPHFDANLVVIGAGSAGLVTAYIASAVKAKAVLVEKGQMGGDCLNSGCVPSKALIHAAKVAHTVRSAADAGIRVGVPAIDFAKVMAGVRQAVDTIAPNDSMERYRSLGVECIAGEAQLVSPWQVEVDGRRLSARNIVIATGARPALPAIPGIEVVDVLTSENLWRLESLPQRLLILGGGPVGCELAQAFQRLGSEVTLAQRASRLLPKLDTEAGELLADLLASEGVEVRLKCQIESIEPGVARGTCDGAPVSIACDRILMAVGRAPNTEGLGLEKLGIRLGAKGFVEVNKYLQTRYPNVFACGDVCGPFQMTHASSHQAWYASVNALFRPFKKFAVDYRLMPAVVYTDPEIATVGLTLAAAEDKDIACEVTRYSLDDLDRAIADRRTEGFVKVLTKHGSDRILGVVIVAPRAGEMLGEFITAMKHNKGLNSVLGTIHAYPGYLDANKLAAGQWKRNHAPEKLLAWLARFHRWRR